MRLLLALSSPGAAWTSSEGNPLFARLRANRTLSTNFAAALARHFVAGPFDLKPPPEEEPSIVGDVWNVFKLPFQAALDLVAGEGDAEPQDPVGLHGHSLRLLLVLGKGLIGCAGDDQFLRAKDRASCPFVVDALMELTDEVLECYQGWYRIVAGDISSCRLAAEDLNDLLVGVADIGCAHNGVGFEVHATRSECEDTALALSTLIADRVDQLMFQTFLHYSAAIGGIIFLGTVWLTFEKLDGNKQKCALFIFAFFVTSRVFDLASDWATYYISLSGQHTGTPLRHACLAFAIIGSPLLLVDLYTMLNRALHWFGIQDDDDVTLHETGMFMLAIVLLEDVPQMVITIVFLVDIHKTPERAVDGTAVFSLACGILSMIGNFVVAIQSLRA